MNLPELQTFPYAAFDFDGTLADSNRAYIRFCQACFLEAGRPVPQAFLERAKAMSLSDFCTELSETLGCWDRAEVARRLTSFTEDFYSRRVMLKPGAREYLELLRRRGTHMCILSATAERFIRMALEHLRLTEYFPFIVTPEQVHGLSKNRPDIFFLACRRFNTPSRHLVVLYDDSLEALRTAREAGLTAVGVYDDAGADTASQIRAVCDAYIMGFDELLHA